MSRCARLRYILRWLPAERLSTHCSRNPPFAKGRFMALSQLLDFLKAATGFVRPDATAVDAAGESGVVATRYHRRIVLIAGTCGAIAAIGGAVAAVIQPPGAKDYLKMILLFPLVFGVIGILEGVAVACLVAPRDFLSGPVG